MKILYFFQELGTPMFQWQRMHFIEELGHHNIIIESFNPLLYNDVEEANEKLIEKVQEGKYDLFLSNAGYYGMLFVETVEAIKKIGIPTMRIAWDNISIPYVDKVLGPHFDLLWLTAKDNIGLYEKWGAKTFFAPYAANPYTFTFNLQNIKRHVCFVGNPHGSRAIMINKLTEAGVRVDYYHGKNPNTVETKKSIEAKYNIIEPSPKSIVYRRLFFPEGRKMILGSMMNKFKGQTEIVFNEHLHKNFSVSHDDMVSIYSNAALSLASTSVGHTDILKNPVQWLFLRNFEIPMCGGIEICKYSPEVASYFEDGKEIILYKTNEELVDKAKYYTEKASDKELLTIKEAARRRSENEHTWFCRFKQAFDILGLKY